MIIRRHAVRLVAGGLLSLSLVTLLLVSVTTVAAAGQSRQAVKPLPALPVPQKLRTNTPHPFAVTRTVTSLADDGSAGTLRSVVAAAGDGDSITFAVTGTIILTQGAIGNSHNLTITGPSSGVGITISGNNSGGIFILYSGTTSLNYLTFSNATQSALAAQGDVTVDHCTFHDNTGGIGGVGAAILTTAATQSLQISNSTFYNNASAAGAAAYMSAGTNAIVNSTIVNRRVLCTFSPFSRTPATPLF